MSEARPRPPSPKVEEEVGRGGREVVEGVWVVRGRDRGLTCSLTPPSSRVTGAHELLFVRREKLTLLEANVALFLD